MKEKHILVLLFFLLLNVILNSQIQFKENIIAEILVHDPKTIFSVDLDQDNDLDLLIASRYDHKISWFENLGMGVFGEQHIISSEVLGASDVIAIDLDNDGDMDVISESYLDDKIVWFENLGNGEFGSQQIITTLVDHPTDIFSIDIDNDGDFDILSTSYLDNKVAWYANDGNGNFGPQIIVSNLVNIPISVYAIDLDQDDDIDILSASILDNKIAWYENLGSGVFGSQQIISSQGIPRSVFSIDIDGDNKNDVIATILTSCIEVVWFKNNGNGNFSSKQVISTQDNHSIIYSCDVDGDGSNDVFAPPNLFFNNGAGSFGNPFVIDSLVSAYTFADLNNDSNIDFTMSYNFGNIVWYSNSGLGNFGSRNKITYSTTEPNKLVYIDLDGDSLNDIVVGSGDDLISECWFKNYGNGSFTIIDTINTGFDQVYDLCVTDLDGDNIKDVVSLYIINSIKYLGWNKQDNFGQFGPIQVLKDSADGGFELHVDDMDGDGDIDILFGSLDSNSGNNTPQLSMLKNDGAGNFGNEIVLRQCLWAPKDIKAFDFDNDGNMDILFTDNKVMIGKNLGGVNNFQFSIIGNTTYCSRAVNAADMDGDNDLDVVYSTDSNNPLWGSYLSWLKNDGSGSFTTMQPLYYPWHTGEIELKDMDMDGDIDIIANQFNEDNSLFWLENDGLGNFVYTTGGYTWNIKDSIDVTSIVVDDLDGDGDNDVLYNSKIDGLIAWAENLGYGSHNSDSACANQSYTFGNQVLTSPGTYQDTLQSVFGLDSVIELEFSHIPIPTVFISPFPQDTFCIQDEFIDLPQVSPIGGFFSGLGVSVNNINLNHTDTGTHEISYHFTDTTTGCSNSDTLQFVVIDCLTIPEAEELGISVYPNPADKFIIVEVRNIPVGSNIQMCIFDVSAKVVIEIESYNFPYKIDISQLKSGMYYLQLIIGNKTVVYKVVKR